MCYLGCRNGADGAGGGTIDAVATLIHTVQEKWEEKKLAAALFMDLKGAFDHVSKGSYTDD